MSLGEEGSADTALAERGREVAERISREQSNAEQAGVGPPCDVCDNRPAVEDGRCAPCAALNPKQPCKRRENGA